MAFIAASENHHDLNADYGLNLMFDGQADASLMPSTMEEGSSSNVSPSGFDDNPGQEDPEQDAEKEDPEQDTEKEDPEQDAEKEDPEQDAEKEDPGVISAMLTSGDVTSTSALLSERGDWPQWFPGAIDYLQGISALESWATLLASLVKFERSLGFRVTGVSKHDLVDLQDAD
jgi:hypothetical protein